ncbi:octopamine receptor Oamb isoform X1 [Anastrepha ludens]|uniref:octopamine receptor Oamb isoform X1 n=1 Tax=Anastrepha ludens TaxID=28586 RepID=UPI0023AED79D|nr:octopamine receptor Oamb isoform X1 [Anastrepha ludens]
MNETECDNLVTSLKWTDPANVISLAILLFIILLVISGNSLVIAAVFCSNKLRSVTNYLIVNLAVADLLVGLAVLPFSATWEVFKVWIFGDVWCSIWLAVDVWMCTASILNLCAISLDRYVAVTRPVAYPSIMSTKRAKSLIAGIWVLSFVICFPPLVGWKDHKPTIQPTYMRGNYTLFYSTTSASMEHKLDFGHVQHPQPYQTNQSLFLTGITPAMAMAVTDGFNYPDAAYVSLESGEFIDRTVPAKFFYGKSLCSTKCELTNDRGYVVYSALGSFYIPMLVMLFFYWRIYRAAVRTTRAIKQGFKTTKGSPRDPSNNKVNDSQLILRIHRGRPCNTPQRTPLSVHSMSSTLSMNSNGEDSYPTSHHQSVTTQSNTPKRATSMRIHRQRHEKISIKVSFPSTENMLSDSHSTLVSSNLAYSTNNKPTLTNGRRASFKTSLFEIGETTFNTDNCVGNTRGCVADGQRDIEAAVGDIGSGSNSSGKKRGYKRNAKFQAKRFRMETKAAKTLAIIVGGFIFCWLPFFTIYLIRAFCEECIEPTVFSVLFWLGYCNSAVNPLIYALFSNEFRIAFKRIICRCVCTRSGFRASENFHMIAARALMAPATFHKTISGSGSDDEDAGINFS